MMAAQVQVPPPGLMRRLACLLYEQVLLFALAVVVALVFSPLVGQKHALTHRYGLMAAVGLAFAVYFVYFWSKSGQTLAMKTWHLRLVDKRGMPPAPSLALLRYLLGWLWCLPALFAVYLLGLQDSTAHIFTSLLFGVIAYALLSRALPHRQFLHDVLCGTQLITFKPVKKTRPG